MSLDRFSFPGFAYFLGLSFHYSLILYRRLTRTSQVTDYLTKKGYKRTEAIFSQEVKDLDENGKPNPNAGMKGSGRFLKAFNFLHKWVENGLDLHKVGLAHNIIQSSSQGAVPLTWMLIVRTQQDAVASLCLLVLGPSK